MHQLDEPKYVLNRADAYGGGDAIREERGKRRLKHPTTPYKDYQYHHPSLAQIVEAHEKESRVFVMERRQVVEFEHADWTDYNPDFCCPPYQTFVIRPAKPIPLTYGDSVFAGIHPYLYETLVYTGDGTKWFGIERLHIELPNGVISKIGTGVWVDIERGVCSPVKFDDEWLGGVGAPREFSVREKFLEQNGELLYTECQVTARNVISFLHFINNRKVEIKHFEDPDRPINRQQRRAAGYVDRDYYKVTIPPTKAVYELVMQAVGGRELRYRRPHWVRGHPRKVRGRAERTWVKPHKRCGDPGENYVPEYDAGRIRPENLEPINA